MLRSTRGVERAWSTAGTIDARLRAARWQCQGRPVVERGHAVFTRRPAGEAPPSSRSFFGNPAAYRIIGRLSTIQRRFLTRRRPNRLWLAVMGPLSQTAALGRAKGSLRRPALISDAFPHW